MKKSILKIIKMKKAILTIFFALPFFVFAQKDCNFFDHRIVQIEKTNINTSGSDMGPSFVNDELWYSAFTSQEIQELSKEKSKGIFYHLFSTSINANGDLTGGKDTKLAGISSGRHAGPVSYCEATGELFVTLSNYDEPDIKNAIFKKADIRLKIAIAKEINGDWKITEELPFNSSKYSVGHPAITTTGDTLYFTSNMPNSTLGGTDLYRSVREDGKWGEPVNLGNKINTTGDEMFPFVYHDGTLIFASNGKKAGATDLDLYYSCSSGDSYTEPISLSEFNSNADDFGLVIHKNGKVGYFSSQREDGVGDDDIYKVLFEKGVFKLELLVRDKDNLQPIPSALVSFSDGQKLLTDRNGIIRRDLDYNTGYTATSEIKGYMDISVSFSTGDTDLGVIKETIDAEKLAVGKKFTVDNIYYNFDKWDLLPKSKEVLDRLVRIMKENPELKAELGSHTDCRGTDAYNMKLSQKRSDSAVKYIISKGISSDRIISKGYGETQLVNNCDDGVPCTEEQHRMNRRTEFKILEITK
jgi:outer membrane protein OmpA-like peptidoglycan-associated protein